jgi:hypothetical protein
MRDAVPLGVEEDPRASPRRADEGDQELRRGEIAHERPR